MAAATELLIHLAYIVTFIVIYMQSDSKTCRIMLMIAVWNQACYPYLPVRINSCILLLESRLTLHDLSFPSVLVLRSLYGDEFR